ncbi:hypothetical protein ES703_113554 [subsurface metagenome]
MAAGAIVVMLLVMLTEVISRYFFGHPLTFSVDIAQLALLVLLYLSVALVLRTGGHVRIDVVAKHLHGRLRQGTELICTIVGLGWSVVIVWLGCLAFWEAFTDRLVTVFARFLIYPILLAIPLGGLLLLLAFLVQFTSQVRSARTVRLVASN